MAKSNSINPAPKNKAEAIALILATRRIPDDFMNASEWCKRYGKEWKRFNELQSTRDYVRALSDKLRVGKNDLIIQINGRGRGSSIVVHPLIFLQLIRWLDVDIAIFANEIFAAYLDGDSDVAADMMIRDHNKGRLERAKSRLRVVDANKQVAELAIKNSVRPDQVHNDRYRGLYQKTCGQLRSDAQALGLNQLRDDETPLNLMSNYDLAINEIANLMALRSSNPNAIFSCSTKLRAVHEQETGSPLVPEWKDNRMAPQKARRMIASQQFELPL